MEVVYAVNFIIILFFLGSKPATLGVDRRHKYRSDSAGVPSALSGRGRMSCARSPRTPRNSARKVVELDSFAPGMHKSLRGAHTSQGPFSAASSQEVNLSFTAIVQARCDLQTFAPL